MGEGSRASQLCVCVRVLGNYCPIMPALFVRGYTRKNTLNCSLRVIFKGESHDRRWRLVTKPSNVASRLLCGFRHTARASASMTSDPLAHLHLVQLREGGANSAGVTVQSHESRAEVRYWPRPRGWALMTGQVSCHGHKPTLTQWKLQQKQVLTIKTPVLIVSYIKCYITHY